jgi:transaldolase
VEELIGPQTVDTMPLDTIQAFLDHGRLERTLDRDVDAAHEVLGKLEAQGISMKTVTDELIDEGVASFAKSFDDLIGAIDSQRKALTPA